MYTGLYGCGSHAASQAVSLGHSSPYPSMSHHTHLDQDVGLHAIDLFLLYPGCHWLKTLHPTPPRPHLVMDVGHASSHTCGHLKDGGLRETQAQQPAVSTEQKLLSRLQPMGDSNQQHLGKIYSGGGNA